LNILIVYFTLDLALAAITILSPALLKV
jgi:hypothetical protein